MEFRKFVASEFVSWLQRRDIYCGPCKEISKCVQSVNTRRSFAVLLLSPDFKILHSFKSTQSAL